MVPVVLGLMFFPLTLILLQKYEEDWKPFFLIPLVMGALWLIHGTTAVAVGIVLVIHMVFGLVFSPPRRPLPILWLVTLFIVPASALVALALNPSYFRFTLSALAGGYRMALPPILSVVPQFGYIPAVLFVLGVGLLIIRGGWRHFALAVSSAVFLLYVLSYRRWFEVGPDILYERSWLYAMLLMALVAGYALATIRQMAGSFIKNRYWATSLMVLLVVGVAAVSLAYRIDRYKKEYYYRIVGMERYYDFVFMREKLLNQSVVMLDPYVARALPAIAEKYAYQAASSPGGVEEYTATKKFFEDGARDTQWLKEKRIDILYSDVPLKNPDLVGVRDGSYKVYILREDVAGARVPLPGDDVGGWTAKKAFGQYESKIRSYLGQLKSLILNLAGK
ncbi:MAG: hypothetical protein HW402_1527 [Dehalococcoidales bacterium]|nr:hypothetical protein [Dehalococcoidales bacterium]